MANDYAYFVETFDTYNSIVKKFLLIVGMWPIMKPGVTYCFIGIFAVMADFLTAIAVFRFAIIHISNIGIAVKGISAACSIGLTCLKGFLMLFYKKDLHEVYEIVKYYHEESLKSGSSNCHMLECVLSFRYIQKLQILICGAGISIYILSPLLALMQHSFTNTSSIAQTLPIPAVFPWRIQPVDGLYIATYIYVSYSLLVSLCSVCGIDAFFSLIILHIVSQLRVISDRMENIQKEDDYNDAIKNCVTKYTILRKCCMTLQDVFGPVILALMIINSVIICTVFFELSQVKQLASISITKYIVIFCHVMTKIIQTYNYAYAGAALTSASKKFLNAAYSSNWQISSRQHFRTSVLITLTQRPLEIVIVKFILVSMDTFVTTINSTISYFFLLKTLEQKSLNTS